jgi:hypothetical protein
MMCVKAQRTKSSSYCVCECGIYSPPTPQTKIYPRFVSPQCSTMYNLFWVFPSLSFSITYYIWELNKKWYDSSDNYLLSSALRRYGFKSKNSKWPTWMHKTQNSTCKLIYHRRKSNRESCLFSFVMLSNYIYSILKLCPFILLAIDILVATCAIIVGQ